MCPRDSPSWALGHLSLVCTIEAQPPYQAHWEKKGGFTSSLSFHLFLNVPRLAQQPGSPWLQFWPRGLWNPGSPCLPQGWAIREDVTSRKGYQIRRCFSVWGDEIFNPCSLWDMHHGRFTYLLLSDSSGWQGRWQLTHINPAARHKLSLQSRNPSLLFKHRGGVLVPNTEHRQHLHWKVNIAGSLGGQEALARPSAPAAPAGPAAVGLVPEQPSTKGTPRDSWGPTADLADGPEWEENMDKYYLFRVWAGGSFYWSFSRATQQDSALTPPLLKAAGGVKSSSGSTAADGAVQVQLDLTCFPFV